MALYHLHCDIIGRSKGKSAVGSVGYQFRMNVTDKTTNEKLYYSKKSDKPLDFGFENPTNAPSFAQCKNKKDVANFWNEVQKKENRKNSQFARDFDIALQKELPLEQNIECLKKWIKKNYTDRGLCASWAIHDGHDGNGNIHAHVMVALRKVDENGWTEKDRKGNDREFLENVRESWATIVNDKFIEWRMDERISSKSYKKRGIDKVPQEHKGAARTAMERNGVEFESENIHIQENEILQSLEKDDSYRDIEENLILYLNYDNVSNEVLPLFNKLDKSPYTSVALENKEMLKVKNWIDYVQVNNKEEWDYYQNEFLRLSKTNDVFGTQRAMEQRMRVFRIGKMQEFNKGDENYQAVLDFSETTKKYYPNRFEKVKNWLQNAMHPRAIFARIREKIYRKNFEKKYPRLSHEVFGTELKQENNTPQIRPPKNNGYSR